MLLARLLTARSIRSRPARLLLSTFGIVLGVAGILAIGITNQTALSAVTRLFADTSGKSNLAVVSTASEDKGFAEKILPRVAASPGIATVIPVLHIQTLLAEDATPEQIGLSLFGASTGGGLTLYGIDPEADQQARDYQVVAGRFLSDDLNADEVVLVDSYADEKDLKVGDSVEILAGQGVEKLQLVGLIAKEGPGQLNNGNFGVLPLRTAQRLFDRDGKLDQVDIMVTPETSGAEKLEQLKSSLQARLGRDYSVVFPATQGKRMTQMLGNYQIGLNFLSGMALFVGAFLIYNAFSMTVVERTREFGMLRTVGMTRSQVTGQVLGEAFVMGIVGSALGIGLGILMAGGLTRLMAVMLGQDLTQIEIPMSVVITGAIVGLIVTIIAAAIPALQAGRISPLEALRVRASGRPGWLIRQGWWLGLLLLGVSTVILVINPFPYDVQFRLGSIAVFSLFLGGTLLIPASVSILERLARPAMRMVYGTSGQLGSGNVQRAKQRTTLTVAALMIGVAMIIVVWAMTGSFKNDLDEWLKGYIGGDLYVTSSLPIRRDVWNRLATLEGVAAVAPVRYFEVEWHPPGADKEKVTFMAFDPASYSQVTSFVFSKDQNIDPKVALDRLAQGDAIFISSVLSEKYGLEPGDRVRLATRTGEQEFEIAAVVVDFFNQGLVIDGSWMDMVRYFRHRDANALFLKVKPGYPVDTLQKRIDDQYSKTDRLVTASNRSLLERVTKLTNQAFSLFDVLAIIALLVAFLGIMNTMTMNVMERTQEIGMLRSVGMTRGQVVQMVLAEAGMMGIIGGGLGLVFGTILARIFMAAMATMSGYSLTYSLPTLRILLAFLISVLVANLAALLPALRGARIRILDAIQYE